jgi:hypothetical protein
MGRGLECRKQPIILTDEIVPPPALVRAGLDALPPIIRARGERASRRFIEFFTADIRNRNTRGAYARAVKQFFDWIDKRRLELHEIEAIDVTQKSTDLSTATTTNSTAPATGSSSTTTEKSRTEKTTN